MGPATRTPWRPWTRPPTGDSWSSVSGRRGPCRPATRRRPPRRGQAWGPVTVRCRLLRPLRPPSGGAVPPSPSAVAVGTPRRRHRTVPRRPSRSPGTPAGTCPPVRGLGPEPSRGAPGPTGRRRAATGYVVDNGSCTRGERVGRTRAGEVGTGAWRISGKLPVDGPFVAVLDDPPAGRETRPADRQRGVGSDGVPMARRG